MDDKFATGFQRRAKKFVAFLRILVLALATGCSSFNCDWRKTPVQPAPNSVEGRWEGRWLSDANGHSGKLRCLMTRINETQCRARFRATYAGILHFSYTVPLTMQPHFGGWEFDGEANLGKLAGGVYYYEGRMSPTNFWSTYKSKYDHGTFQLHRPE